MKIIAQIFVYRCDHDHCTAAVARDFEGLPPDWQEIRTGRTTGPAGELEAKHYCPNHHPELIP